MNYDRVDKVDTDVATTIMAQCYKGFGTGNQTQNGVIEVGKVE